MDERGREVDEEPGGGEDAGSTDERLCWDDLSWMGEAGREEEAREDGLVIASQVSTFHVFPAHRGTVRRRKSPVRGSRHAARSPVRLGSGC